MTKLAVSGKKAAFIMLEAGLSCDNVQKGVDSIHQPTSGYYYIDDVYKFVSKHTLHD